MNLPLAVVELVYGKQKDRDLRNRSGRILAVLQCEV